MFWLFSYAQQFYCVLSLSTFSQDTFDVLQLLEKQEIAAQNLTAHDLAGASFLPPAAAVPSDLDKSPFPPSFYRRTARDSVQNSIRVHPLQLLHRQIPPFVSLLSPTFEPISLEINQPFTTTLFLCSYIQLLLPRSRHPSLIPIRRSCSAILTGYIYNGTNESVRHSPCVCTAVLL